MMRSIAPMLLDTCQVCSTGCSVIIIVGIIRSRLVATVVTDPDMVSQIVGVVSSTSCRTRLLELTKLCVAPLSSKALKHSGCSGYRAPVSEIVKTRAVAAVWCMWLGAWPARLNLSASWLDVPMVRGLDCEGLCADGSAV